MPNLLLITNPANGAPEEDESLAKHLAGAFNVEVVSIDTTVQKSISGVPESLQGKLLRADVALLRNAWPSRLFDKELTYLVQLAAAVRLPLYNPPPRAGYVEDKTYLIELTQLGFPVIPTALDPNDLTGDISRYLTKPIDGCSSHGVEVIERRKLPQASLEGRIIQPWFSFVEEVSYFFIDDQLAYALRTQGRERWDLAPFTPPLHEIAWAQNFVTWNGLPYGLQRIDAGRQANDELLLMEIEDTMPYLSLDCLTDDRIGYLVNRLVSSLSKLL